MNGQRQPRIAIASGKGGTGKTTVAVNLAALAAAQGTPIALVDCDVEEPNCHLFLRPHWEIEVERTIPVPEVNTAKCVGESCRQCVQLCRFKALIWMAGEVMVFPELCHACGLCYACCPADALKQGARIIGQLRGGRAERAPVNFVDGLLRVGEAMSPPLIHEAKNHAAAVHHDCIQLWDCPPGTSCPVIMALGGADYALLVAEPTPFGLHDLDLAVQTLRHLGLPFGVAINRDGMGDDKVRDYLAREGIELLGSLPWSREAAIVYSNGELLVDTLPELRTRYEDLWYILLQRTLEAMARQIAGGVACAR